VTIERERNMSIATAVNEIERQLKHGEAEARCYDDFEVLAITLHNGFYHGGAKSKMPVSDSLHGLSSRRSQSEYTLHSPTKELLLDIISAAETLISGINKRELKKAAALRAAEKRRKKMEKKATKELIDSTKKVLENLPRPLLNPCGFGGSKT
jgi:hypothetical protein